MLRGQNFHVDPRRVVHETIDDETIIIDLDTGTYYSLRGSAPTIWGLLVQELSELEVVHEMRRRYPGHSQAVSDATVELIGRLYEEGLIKHVDPAKETAAVSAELRPEALEEFEAPLFEKYTDMTYFLLLDPIHEVEEGGWPRAAAADGAPTPAE